MGRGRGKGKGRESVSRTMPEEDDGTAEADHVVANDSIQMETDEEQFKIPFVDGDEVETLEATSQPDMTVDPLNDENKLTGEKNEENVSDVATNEGENVLKEAEAEFTAVSVHGGKIETPVHATLSEPNISVVDRDKNTVEEERDGENVADSRTEDGEGDLKEVSNGEYVDEIATADGEDVLKEEGRLAPMTGEPENEQNKENNGDGDSEGKDGENVDALKEEHLGEEENKEALCTVIPEQVDNNKCSTEENDKDEAQKSTAKRPFKSRKRKRGKQGAKGPMKKLASQGNMKSKVPSNGEEGAENEGDTVCKDDSTRQEQENGEGKTEENNKKKVGESSKQRLTQAKKRKRGKMTTRPEQSSSKIVASEGGGSQNKTISNREDKEPLKVGAEGKNNQGLEKRASKGEAPLGSKNVAAEAKDVPESSNRKKSKEKAEAMGLIFMCNSETKKDCYRYNILGLPANKRKLVENIYTGMRLFLYDVDLKLMYGIYKAAGTGGYNIEPKAFKSQFPSQVRFKVLIDCKPIPEEKFKKAIKKNYYTRNKFDCKLNSEQVKDLCKLFRADSQVSSAKKLKVQPKKESKRVVEPHGTRKQGADRGRRPKPESRRGVERDRTRKYEVERDRRPRRSRPPVKEHRYHEFSRHYERDGVAPLVDRLRPSPPAPVAQGSHLIPSQLYVYDRPLEIDAPRRAPLLLREDPYRRDILEEPRDVLVDHHRYYRQEPPPPSASNLHYSYRQMDDIPYRHEITDFDRPASYHEPVYRTVPPAALPVEYYDVDRSTEYRSARVSVPEYHVSSRSVPEYHHTGLRPEYQSSAGLRRYPY